MTKADKIRKLYAHGIFTNKEIAERVGCGESYVRTAARQRVSGIGSEADRRYYTAHQRERCALSKRWREANIDYVRERERRRYYRRKAALLEAAE